MLGESYWRLRLEGQGHVGHGTDSREGVCFLRWSVFCYLLSRDPGGSSAGTLPSKDWWRGVLGSCCLTGFALGPWFTHTELRPETYPSILARWDTACCRKITEDTNLKKSITDLRLHYWFFQRLNRSMGIVTNKIKPYLKTSRWWWG